MGSSLTLPGTDSPSLMFSLLLIITSIIAIITINDLYVLFNNSSLEEENMIFFNQYLLSVFKNIYTRSSKSYLFYIRIKYTYTYILQKEGTIFIFVHPVFVIVPDI